MTQKLINHLSKRMHARTGQQGATLAIVLIFLVLVTLVGVTALTTTTLEERMAGNLKDRNLALQAAEAGLRDAKLDISGGKVVVTATPRSPIISGATDFGNAARVFPSCSAAAAGTATAGLCLSPHQAHSNAAGESLSARDNTWILGQSFTAAPSIEYGTYTGAPALSNVALQPRYLIEAISVPPEGKVGPVYWYRITARGYGARAETNVTLQEVIRAP